MELKLPDLGEGVVEGEIVKWHVKPGDSIKEDQVVLEIMTDKATVEIPSKFGGKVSELCFKEGEIAKVGSVVLRAEGAASGAKAVTAASVASPVKAAEPSVAKAPAPKALSAAPAVSLAVVNQDPQAAPAVRKAARDRGIDLRSVMGSGPHGRVLLSDLDRGPTARAGAGIASRAVRGQRQEDRVPVRGLRRKIIEKMALSKRTAAHFTYVEECDVTELNEFRQKLKAEGEKRGAKMTFLPFIIKAVTIGLKEFPDLNATLVEEGGSPTEIIYKKYYNIGIAVDTDDGLTVPVLKDADCKGMWEVAKEMNELAQKARDKKLAPADLQEGTFTITNAGNIGGLLATPVINYPEVAILGIHQMKRRPMVIGDEIRIRDVMYLSVSLDHRVVDGAVAARFMNRVVGLLQEPKKLLMEMLGEGF
jgi:pyruvate dehydrogenase E2 component (dihydrolipoamide acetyltransferase)